MAVDVYQIVTEKITAQLEKGIVPWQRPWDASVGQPRNLDGRHYRGINVLLLGLSGYDDPRWGTYKAISEKGGKVIKGEKGSIAVFFKMLESKTEVDSKGRPKKIPMLRYFTVFNVKQTEGLELPTLDEGLTADVQDEDNDVEALGAAVIDGYSDCPDIRIDSIGASYNPTQDEIRMPDEDRFISTAHYYLTLFHEAVHSTGHTKRLARDEIVKGGSFGSQSYSREELVAEIGSAMIATMSGIPTDIPNSASYIASWLKALRNDKKMVVSAANRAQHAAEYILEGRKPEGA